MSDRDIFPDDRFPVLSHMDDGIVLDIRIFTDDDPLKITSQDGAVPDTDAGRQHHISGDRCVSGDSDPPAGLIFIFPDASCFQKSRRDHFGMIKGNSFRPDIKGQAYLLRGK